MFYGYSIVVEQAIHLSDSRSSSLFFARNNNLILHWSFRRNANDVKLSC